MERDAAEVLRDALALDPEVDVGADVAWREEVGRRLNEIDSGRLSLFRGKRRADACDLD
jgi:hypothetical protein